MLPRLTYLIIIENNRNFKYTGTDTDTDERNTQLKCEFEQNAAEMIICADQIDLYYTILCYASYNKQSTIYQKRLYNFPRMIKGREENIQIQN